MKRLASLIVAGAVGAATIWAVPNAAQPAGNTPVSLRDTFPVGSNGLCEAQIIAPEKGADLFDRRYSIICRDAAAPIGTMWVVRGDYADRPESRFGLPGASCRRAEDAAAPEGLGGASELVCDGADSPLRSRLIVGRIGERTYAASGFNAYASALRLGLASLATDRVAEGKVDIPLTQATDALAFARQQAEAISADQALVEAYRRSNQGEFAEAAEFFAASAEVLSGRSALDARLNEGLLQSNLGNYAEADRLFARTRAEAANDPVLARLQRNYEAIHALNQGKAALALERIDRPLANEFGDPVALRQLTIGPAMANRLEAESRSAGGTYSVTLTPLERAQLLDGQADYLRATALRLAGRAPEATRYLRAADTAMAEVRGGRVESILWLRAQVLGELAEVAEIEGRPGEAEGFHKAGIDLLESRYPESPALQSARAQLAGFYARTGRRGDALGLYRGIVKDAEGRPLPALRSLLTPYFNLLLGGEGKVGDASAAADIFAASQLLQRPGLAQTQAVLARELSAGSDEAAQLFRRTTNIGRSIEQLRSGIAEIEALAEVPPRTAQVLAERRARLEQLEAEQAEVLEALAQYPRYRAVTGSALDLAQLQGILKEGEAYVKLVTLEEESYVIVARKDDALAYEAAISPEALEEEVDRLRETIAIAEGGQVLTFPFDIERSRKLYLALFEPVADQLPALRHIVFEPDGAMLRLPINLLVTDDESVTRYKERLARSGDDYDFTGTKWLGRNAEISTSVAATAFRDVRAAAPSDGKRSYLGLGQNTPIGESDTAAARTRAALAGGENCSWSPNIWANPIAADELYTAAERFGAGASVVTRDDFTDSKIRNRDDLTEYRILHFATHGLVTAPQPECPPRPALLTSFGGDDESDGLLSFSEIFGLRIDADLVILSACDTAGGATIGATREAGVTSGGDFALDGLVRAFVGAGGRTVLASHWPVPDDYDATKRLISGLFTTDGAETAEALRSSQVELMDSAETSHPFYWSAFAVVGDGTIPVRR